MLEEVIEYMRQLQAQVLTMGRMKMSSMMLPLAMQQQLSDVYDASRGNEHWHGDGDVSRDMNAISQLGGVPSVIPPTAPLMPVPLWDKPGIVCQRRWVHHSQTLLSTFLACQSQVLLYNYHYYL
ncbi:hypothetical protein Salat_1059400 [Sesamum alatum]|uniref:BHLH domain-containing protein n=1 Tax=Sesamum alatum TaxID=300844 RepID=A0AAE1YMY1_9LAMI|nr:hypothetical protein Salat_1059400 [Sesamum alatum]